MKQERLSALFYRVASTAKPPPQNLAAVLLSLAEYCLRSNMAEECVKVCERIMDIGNGQQREAAKTIRSRLEQAGRSDTLTAH